PTLTNVIISNNVSYKRSGGVYNFNSNCTFINTTIADNILAIDNSSNALQQSNSTSSFSNSIVYGSILSPGFTYRNSLINGAMIDANGNAGVTGIAMADVFANSATGDYTLLDSSPAVDAGDKALYSDLRGTTKDLAGNSRLVGTKIDLG